MKAKEIKYEENILASFERGEWQSLPDFKDEIARYTATAASTLANQHSSFFAGPGGCSNASSRGRDAIPDADSQCFT